ncbi:MAG: hypothetical protein AAF715_29775 [Myxococcota bacterium]
MTAGRDDDTTEESAAIDIAPRRRRPHARGSAAGVSRKGWSGLVAALGLVAGLVGGAGACKSTVSDDSSRAARADDDDGEDRAEADEDGGAGESLNARSRRRGPAALGVAEDGDFMVDSGFRPSKHGFVFPNGDRDARGRRQTYPASSPGFLDGDGMQRLFGSDQVCLGDGDDCVLSPGAREFMHMVNKVMNRGQCEGLAVFSLSMFNGFDQPDYFKDGAKIGSELMRDDARAAVGYYFAFQFLQPMRNDLFGRMRAKTPNKVLADVKKALASKDDMVALEFIQPGKGGHAVVPYAVEDMGKDIYRVRIWDNNFPKVSRFIEFDTGANTWKYSFAAINPNEDPSPWSGGAFPNTIIETPVSLRMRDMVCPFCKKAQKSRLFMVAGNSVNATITDGQGRKLGWHDGKVVNEIPGAQIHPTLAFVPGEGTPEAMYEVPADDDYDISLTSEKGDDDVAVGVFGEDAAMVVEDIKVAEKETDHLVVKRSGLDVDYRPARDTAAPRVRMAVGTGADAYQVRLEGAQARKGHALKFKLDRRNLRVQVADDGKPVRNVKYQVARFNRAGVRSVVTDADAPVKAGSALSLRGIRGKVVPDGKRFVRRRLSRGPTPPGVKRGIRPRARPERGAEPEGSDATNPRVTPRVRPQPKGKAPAIKVRPTEKKSPTRRVTPRLRRTPPPAKKNE